MAHRPREAHRRRMATPTDARHNPGSLSTSIEERLERIEQKLDTLLARVRAASPAVPRASEGEASNGSRLEAASDADLDSPRGDPEVRFVPKRWTGEDYKGRRYSECSPEFLDMIAEAREYFSRRDDEAGAVDMSGNPKGRWGRLDASRARGWSRRLRARSKDAGRNGSHAHDSDDIPF